MQKQGKIEQIVEILRTRILSGEYGVQGTLPTRNILAKEFGVAIETVNQAIYRLLGEGLLIAMSSRQIQVVPPRKRVPMTNISFVEFLKREGLQPVTEYLELPERKPMDSRLASLFGVAPGTPYIARIRRDGTRQMWYRTTSKYYLADMIDDESLHGMQRDERYDVIADIARKKAMVAQYLDDDTIARLPTSEEQHQLGISHMTPVMDITRTGYDQQGGRVLWLNRIVVVGPLFVLHHERHGPQLWQTLA